jgi:putative hemolysin
VSGTIANIGLVILFVVIGGVFAAAEISLVSLRDSQARALASRGRRGQIVAQLNQDPNRFLAAVQVGVTLAGFLSAAFGGATLSGSLAPELVRVGVPAGAADVTALVLVTIAISYLSLVLGELAPKRLGLQRAETFALAFGPSVDRIATVARPVIWVLSKSPDVVVRLLGGDPTAQREQMSDEELRDLVNTHETLGEEERRIVEEVFEAGDRQIREVMIPRTEVDFLDASTLVHSAAAEALRQPHSRYPVVRGDADHVVGFVHVRDLLDPAIDRAQRLEDFARPTLVLPWTRPILAALADMRREGTHLAIVADEYGGTAGIVTMEDLVEELIGDIRDEYDVDEAETTVYRGGDVEVDGLLNLDDFEDETGLELPEGPYETVAGFLMQRLGRLARVGDWVDHDGRRITVREIEGRRVGRVLVAAVPLAADGDRTGGGAAAGADAETVGATDLPEGRAVDRHKPLDIAPSDPAVGAGAIDAAAAEMGDAAREDVAGRG